jgi:hypothetical protein
VQKWRLFGSTAEEKSMHVRCFFWCSNTVLAVLCNVAGQGEQLYLFPHDHVAMSAVLHTQALPTGCVPSVAGYCGLTGTVVLWTAAKESLPARLDVCHLSLDFSYEQGVAFNVPVPGQTAQATYALAPHPVVAVHLVSSEVTPHVTQCVMVRASGCAVSVDLKTGEERVECAFLTSPSCVAGFALEDSGGEVAMVYNTQDGLLVRSRSGSCTRVLSPLPGCSALLALHCSDSGGSFKAVHAVALDNSAGLGMGLQCHIQPCFHAQLLHCATVMPLSVPDACLVASHAAHKSWTVASLESLTRSLSLDHGSAAHLSTVLSCIRHLGCFEEVLATVRCFDETLIDDRSTLLSDTVTAPFLTLHRRPARVSLIIVMHCSRRQT